MERYIGECKELGFDIVEISSGFISIPTDDWLRLVEKVRKAGLKAEPEVGIQFGAGGTTTAAELEAEDRDPHWAILQDRRPLDAGAYMIMIESEGITENVKAWRTRRGCEVHRRSGPGQDHVRSCGPRGLRMVREELQRGSEPLRRPQPDRAAGMPAIGSLGDKKPLGPGSHVQGIGKRQGMATVQLGTVEVVVFRIAEAPEFLVLQRSDHVSIYPGLWQIVSGKLEKGEKAWQAAVREAREETGLLPLKLYNTPLTNTFYVLPGDFVNLSPGLRGRSRCIGHRYVVRRAQGISVVEQGGGNLPSGLAGTRKARSRACTTPSSATPRPANRW